MLPLDSPRWTTLHTAYGPATEIPELLALLEQSERLPESARAAPLDSLWQALCHQGQPDEAAYAAVPHMARIVAGRPPSTGKALLHLVGSIVANQDHGAPIPQDLEASYNEALSTLRPIVLARVQAMDKGSPDLLADLAAVVGHRRLARALAEWSSGEVFCRCRSCGASTYLGTSPRGIDASPLRWLELPEPASTPPSEDVLSLICDVDEHAAACLLGSLAGRWDRAVAAAGGVLECSCGRPLPVLEGIDPA